MNKNKINKNLNNQLNLENYSSNLYLQMSAWCNIENYKNASIFFKKNSEEELKHMEKIFNFLCDINILPILNFNIYFKINFNSIQDIFKKAYINEKKITRNINYISNIAFKKRDFKTFHFLSWYILKQNEEEKILKTILDNLKFFNYNNKNFLIFDNLFLSKYI
ncbi:ferritin [Enterobacteriaceae bacterium ET-AT1-13]|nr:ferritin [Enterobacteriaceae bacterium ET-AT1-13]WGS66376.1 ferritin [Enterobacteriaceae bacterium Cmel17]WMC17402.1 MAG: ferritin-like domain-containing protein [Enterobacteriaceae bacterium Cmel21]WMC17608.1 MAG: ferritin [Enterobacteriaceae bacterium PSmelAO3-2]WMC17813.1 MAG: ferritin [Enterobacteriaceae bacterium PSmelAO3-1]WMC18016.1 MAG: ferritin [Enterobacteriaceae bacterium PSmelAO1]